MNDYMVATISGGKDSTAMLLLMMERGIHINTVRHPRGFEWIMFEQPKVKPYCIEKRRERGIPVYGNGWPGPHVRWCTCHLRSSTTR